MPFFSTAESLIFPGRITATFALVIFDEAMNTEIIPSVRACHVLKSASISFLLSRRFLGTIGRSLDRETLPSLAASELEYFFAACGTSALQKSMRSSAFSPFRFGEHV